MPGYESTCTTGCQAIGKVQAQAGAKTAGASVLKMGDTASDGGLKVKMETRGNWQNLSIRISESVILGVSRVT